MSDSSSDEHSKSEKQDSIKGDSDEELDLNDPKVKKFGRGNPIYVKLNYDADPAILLKKLQSFLKECNTMNF